MPRHRRLSPQAIQLLKALLSRPREWRHGYDLTREVGLRSGTLYPLLIRLTEQGLLEAEWLPAAREGLPARHGYRLTSRGTAFARANLEANEPRIGRTGLAPA
jgi:PadR family transcriptional regulator PadR